MRSSTEQARGSFAGTSGVTPELPMALATCEVKEQEWQLQTPKEGEALQPRGGRRGHGAAREPGPRRLSHHRRRRRHPESREIGTRKNGCPKPDAQRPQRRAGTSKSWF